jgi:DNA anti-recombination protein RmuC
MRKLGFILLATLLVVVYGVGYWPQHSQLHKTQERLESVSSQLADAQARLQIYSLSDRLVRLIEKVEEKNYGDAQKLSSEFFDQVHAETTQINDENCKSVLQSILSKRDAVTAGLANATPATAEVLHQSLRELRPLVDLASVPGFTVPPPKTN